MRRSEKALSLYYILHFIKEQIMPYIYPKIANFNPY